jgi:GNAT superfamily N-acetyltransferase
MRQPPAGIELRRAGDGDQVRVMDLVRGEIARYAEWAPGFKPPEPTPDALERLGAVFLDPEVAWILLAETGDEAVGVVSLSLTTFARADPPPAGSVYLWQLFVRRDWQGRGVAGPLMDRVFEEARTRCFNRMLLWTPEGAAQARRFYEKEGWTLSGRADPESDFGLPLVEYERDLS